MEFTPAKQSKREKEFLIGWLGVLGGLAIFFSGLVGRHVLRSRAFSKKTFTNADFLDLWDRYSAPSSDLPSFVMAIGRVIYFVSAVACLFTYEGKQMWTWTLMGTGMLLLIGSGIGSMLQEGTAFLSLPFTGVGALLTLVGLFVVDVYPKSIAAKVLFALAVISGCAAFPVGIFAETEGYSFFLCVVIECTAALFGLLGLLAYLRERFLVSNQRCD